MPLTFVVSAVQIGRVSIDERPVASAEGHSLLRRAREGLSLVLRHPILGPCLGGSTTINFFTLMANALLVLYASRELGLSAGVIGLALGIGAVGGLVGAVAGAAARGARRRRPRDPRRRRALPGADRLARARRWADRGLRLRCSAIVEFVSALGVMLYDVNQNALQATVTPDAVRSRVAGAYSTINYGIRPLGALVGGLLGETFGLRPTLVARRGGRRALRALAAAVADSPDPVAGRPRHARGTSDGRRYPDRAVTERDYRDYEPVTAPEPDTLPSEHDRSRAHAAREAARAARRCSAGSCSSSAPSS